MAKTESTAVNELIGLVQSGQSQPVHDPDSDLFAVPKSTPSATPRKARMTSPVPALRGAGEVEPLPRGRAPHSTSQHETSQQGAPMLPSQVRISTAEVATGNTIPPLPPRASSPATRASGSQAAARPSMPPPRPSQRPTPVSPPVPQRASSPQPSSIMQRPTVPTLPPPIAPVAAPFEVRDDNPLPAQPPIAQQFPSVRKVTTSTTSTHVVPRPLPDTLARKLVVPAIIATLVGVAIGGYIAFGHGGAKANRTTSATAAPAASAENRVAMSATPAGAAAGEPADDTHVAMTATATVPAPSTESANAGTASAGGAQPEPPTKQEDLAKQQATAAIEAAQPPAAAPDPAPAVAPPASAVREVQTPHGVVKLVDVRIDSKPSGATVMLVDGGKTSFLGSTPLATSLDASRSYDVIFTLPGRPTQMLPLNPATTPRLDVTLARAQRSSPSTASSAKKSAPAKLDAFIDTSVEAAKPASTEKPASADKPAKAEKVAKPAKAENTDATDDAKAGGEGTLMVSSKPPCEILIDGKATGLTTPQRSISLPAGAHKVTFVNSGAGINKTVAVTITADKSTKLIQDLMAK